jgi:hypothetical protein
MVNILKAFKKEKRRFDLNNKDDIEVYRQFLINGNKWGPNTCPFILEFPYLTTPDMIKDKLVRKFLKV